MEAERKHQEVERKDILVVTGVTHHMSLGQSCLPLDPSQPKLKGPRGKQGVQTVHDVERTERDWPEHRNDTDRVRKERRHMKPIEYLRSMAIDRCCHYRPNGS